MEGSQVEPALQVGWTNVLLRFCNFSIPGVDTFANVSIPFKFTVRKYRRAVAPPQQAEQEFALALWLTRCLPLNSLPKIFTVTLCRRMEIQKCPLSILPCFCVSIFPNLVPTTHLELLTWLFLTEFGSFSTGFSVCKAYICNSSYIFCRILLIVCMFSCHDRRICMQFWIFDPVILYSQSPKQL